MEVDDLSLKAMEDWRRFGNREGMDYINFHNRLINDHVIPTVAVFLSRHCSVRVTLFGYK